MLHNRNTTIRHDRFFQKGNLDIREQLIEDLYKKVKNEHSDSSDEVQSDWKGAPPIPYKVAKALAPDYYRNIELDIWHELKREVKSAGWNRYNSNELQVGGKCLIEISVNDLEQCDRNNNKSLRVNSSDRGASENNSKIEQQKLKQGPLWLHGYIQEMHTNREPVLVFIKDLGEKKFVPYDALKPLPVVRKNRQKNWVAVNRNHSVNSDSSRRWKKSYNSFSRKKKDNTISMEEVNSLPVVDLNNSQSTLPNSAVQKVGEDHKKAVFRKMNNTARNRTNNSERSNNPRNGLQNSCSKLKVLDENYCSPCNGNQQINMGGNPNVSYVVADNGNAYSVYPYMPGNFGEPNQMDHTFASNFFYNLHLLHLEDTFRTLNPTYYGPVMYGPGGVQPLGAPSGNAQMNNVPCTQEEMEHFVNGMQNCSLTYSEGAGANDEISNTSHWSMNGAQHAGQPKQGLKSWSGKDSSYQVAQKGKQTGTAK
ncbi:otu domain-containing protein 4, partial [Lasius niger]